MCKVGDIIVVENYKSGGKDIGKHSFVVINDEGGEIQGLDYDLICNVMSSFKNERQKTRKLKYEGNFPITHNDTDTNPDSGKDGYIKAEQFYYFDKEKIDYVVIGNMKEEAFNALIEFIENLKINLEVIIDNLQ